MQFADYWGGENKDAIREDMRPGEHHETVTPARKETFLAKVGVSRDRIQTLMANNF